MHPAIADYFAKDLEINLRICEEWGAKVAGPLENQPVFSDIPTLILAGEYDPVTPPSWGRMVTENLDNAYFVEFPGLGHFVFADRRCPREIVAAFLNDPGTSPDSSCAAMNQFNFVTH